eukprot:363049-Chlamydomonas_euryale.AAC.10
MGGREDCVDRYLKGWTRVGSRAAHVVVIASRVTKDALYCAGAPNYSADRCGVAHGAVPKPELAGLWAATLTCARHDACSQPLCKQDADVLTHVATLVVVQDKQKKDEAAAEAAGTKANKLSAGELRIQKGAPRTVALAMTIHINSLLQFCVGDGFLPTLLLGPCAPLWRRHGGAEPSGQHEHPLSRGQRKADAF